MARHLSRAFAAMLVVAALAPSPVAGDAEPAAEPVLEERSRVRLRTLRVRFEPTPDARAGECRDLDLDDLRVRLRGDALGRDRLVALERRREPTRHALLIDTSGSMVGKLDHARRAASEYVERLDPIYDVGLVATFDESVILAQSWTADRDLLTAAIGEIRMGAMTSMLDGLYYGIGTLLPHRERPVLVLLSDGVDSASLQEHDHVRRLAERRDDLIVFTIGYELPSLDSARSGVIATRKFLNRLAESTDGEFFDVPTGGRLDFAFRKIREALENEALLTFLDPEPEAALGKVRVRLSSQHCRLHVYRSTDEPEPQSAVPVDGRMRVGLTAGPRERHLAEQKIHHVTDEPCRDDGAKSLDDLWFAERGEDRIHGCALDVTTDYGLLYSHIDRSRVQHNGWLMMHTRPFELPISAIADLPTTPAELLDDLAREVAAVAADAIDTDARMRPAERHARPWTDIPSLVNGRTLLDSRETFAQVLYGYPQYREWANARLADDVAVELEGLRARFARFAPDASPAAIGQAVAASVEGRRIARRLEAPAPADLQRNLGAWLGDIPAHRLFVDWEIRRTNAVLEGSRADDGFVEAWRALRRVFFVPSYARVLGLLMPVRDVPGDRIGFWRVVLPRPGWLQPRLKNARYHPEWRDLPVDLIPDRPLAFEALREVLVRDPEFGARMTAGAYRVTAVNYVLLGKPYKRDPRNAFRHTQVDIALDSSAAGPDLTLSARVRLGSDGGSSVESFVVAEAPASTPTFAATARAAGGDDSP